MVRDWPTSPGGGGLMLISSSVSTVSVSTNPKRYSEATREDLVSSNTNLILVVR